MLNKVRKYIDEYNLLEEGDKVVLGVSGGADSVCLLYMLLKLKQEYNLSLFVVHINHLIRGNEAYDDQYYVEEICKLNGIECFVFEKDILKMSKDMKISTEEAGRIFRYECFENIRRLKNANKIAVAHNKNDKAETVLHNMIRGTGLKGITGINAKRDNIIRPILCLNRLEIESFLQLENIEFKIDSTNLENDYTRNKIRNNILKDMIEINKNVVNHIVGVSEFAKEVLDFVEIEVDKYYKEFVRETEKEVKVFTKDIRMLNVVLQKSILQRMIFFMSKSMKNITSTHINDLLKLIYKDENKQINLPYNLICKNVYGEIIISKNLVDYKEFNSIKIDKIGKYVINECESIIFSLENNTNFINFSKKVYTKSFDYDKIKDTVYLRTRQSGDYFINSSHKCTLKKFFIDNKIPKDKRDKILLLSDGNHIIWILGYRISDEYKITSDTKVILNVEYVNLNKTEK